MNLKKLKLIAFIMLTLIFKVSSQIIDNKINLYFSGGISKPLGDIDINEDNFITPSLYANYQNILNLKCKGTYKLLSFLSVGLQYKNSMLSNWNNNKDSSLYSNSSTKMHLFGPIGQFHTKFKEQGFFNIVKLYGELRPVLGISSLTLDKPIFEIQGNDGSQIESPLSSSDFVWGVEISTGMEVSVSNVLGLFVDLGISYYKTTSLLYNDKYFLTPSAELGIYFRLFKNKHFYY